MRNSAAIIVLILILSHTVLATKTFEPVFEPRLEVIKTSERIDVDGYLGDPGWKSAARAANFAERQPGDMVKPEVETEAYITYDEDNLYVAFVCYDDPAAIRATMCERDQFGSDDAICLMIDTYGDASWAYELLVNPYGVQKDYLWSSIVGEIEGFDLIWKSAAKITDSGYQVEMAVPFASMRFPQKDVQEWKVDFWRNRPRESFNQYSWAAYDRNDQCWPCQWGTVSGISNVKPGKGLEILPTYVAIQSGSKSDLSVPDSKFENDNIDGELSLGGKYTLSSNFTLEAAYNPDFSQIEADADQIDVNTTIALYFPERRPFFQEGSDIFLTLFNSFYTRMVNDPQFAAKLTGRTDGLSIGFMSAVDENTPYIIPLEESSLLSPSGAGRSYVNVLRAVKSVGENSRLGFIVSDRRFENDGYGTILAVDGDIRLSGNYSIAGQVIASYTREPDDEALTEEWIQRTGVDLNDTYFDNGKYTAAFDGESFSGQAMITQLRRRARHWTFTIDYNHVAPAYRTETGYDPWINYHNLSLYTQYRFYLNNSLLEQITPQLYVDRRWGFDDVTRWRNFNVALDVDFKFAQTGLYLFYGRGFQSWSGKDYENLWTLSLNLNSRFTNQLGVGLSLGRALNAARWAQVRGRETTFDASLSIKPFDRLIIEPNFNFARSVNNNTNEELYDGFITRTRFRYQANRELSLRLVVQYNDFYETMDIDPLLSYRISPFSIFYIGTTHDYGNLEPNQNAPSRWRLTSRQFFMKLQYLFQT